jgi:hypothetical protein
MAAAWTKILHAQESIQNPTRSSSVRYHRACTLCDLLILIYFTWTTRWKHIMMMMLMLMIILLVGWDYVCELLPPINLLFILQVKFMGMENHGGMI